MSAPPAPVHVRSTPAGDRGGGAAAIALRWRFAALGGAVAGVGASPWLPASPGAGATLAVAAVAVLLVLLRPRPRSAASFPAELPPQPPGPGPVSNGPRPLGAARGWATASRAVWLPLIALLAAAAGALAGTARLESIDRGALRAEPGTDLTVKGIVGAVPRRTRGVVSVPVSTPAGRLVVEAPEPIGELPVGREVRASGTLAEPEPWREATLARSAAALVLEARAIRLTGERRGGIGGLVDGVRDRAEAALERGMGEREAALARGFVLGQDDRIDPRTVEEFKRSGLAHLLAVSGQNVVLLALLATPILALLGAGLQTRLLWTLALIALYVPVTGAGPSIQRAGVMGAAGIVAGLAGRPASRWYALGLAALVTLVVNPRASGDVGWQLSFAAVVGILLWAAPLRDAGLGLLGGRRERSGWRRALAEGAAMTIAATVATAPLMAHHFESVSLAALPANLLALPAVAPVMWLGMLAAAAGQLPGLPDGVIGALNALNEPLIAYIAEVGRRLAAPDWALLDTGLPSVAGVAVVYALLIASAWLVLRAGSRRGGLRIAIGPRAVAVAATTTAAALALALGPPAPSEGEPPGSWLEVTVLDVGQGDAILLEPSGGAPVLVDGGPPGRDLERQLRAEGVERLRAAVVTHPEDDHEGGILELLGSLPVRELGVGAADPALLGAARRADTRPVRLAEGSGLRSGELRLDVLWPPRELLEDSAGGPGLGPDPEPPGADPNRLSVVAVARWRGFAMLLTGDAEAEAVPIDPGAVDLLKVAHHGSEDAGLGSLLDRTAPRVAVISAGAGNPFGHPTPPTLSALGDRGVRVLRTDRDGAIEIEVRPEGWTVRTER